MLNSVPGWWTYGFFHVIRDRIHAYLRVSSSSSSSSSPSSSSSSSSSECSTSSTSSTSSADPWSAGFDWSVCTRRELETAAGHLSAAIKALQHLRSWYCNSAYGDKGVESSAAWRAAVYDANDNDIDELAALPTHRRDPAAAGMGNEEPWTDVDPREQELLLQRNIRYQRWQQFVYLSSTQQEQQPMRGRGRPRSSSSSSASSSSSSSSSSVWPLSVDREQTESEEENERIRARRPPQRRRRQGPAK